MSKSRKSTKTPPRPAVDPETRKLLLMPLAERITAVAEDVQTSTDEFSGIDPHELAEILGVPQPWNPAGWQTTCYAEIESVEEYVRLNGADVKSLFI